VLEELGAVGDSIGEAGGQGGLYNLLVSKKNIY